MKRLAWMFAATLAVGCIHDRPVEYAGKVRVTSAELVPINPDVKVVADASEPMFFAAGSYWLFHDAGWYRSERFDGTWTKVDKPPVPVVQIDQPFAYTRYRLDHPTDQRASAEPPPPVHPVDPARAPRNDGLNFGP